MLSLTACFVLPKLQNYREKSVKVFMHSHHPPFGSPQQHSSGGRKQVFSFVEYIFMLMAACNQAFVLPEKAEEGWRASFHWGTRKPPQHRPQSGGELIYTGQKGSSEAARTSLKDIHHSRVIRRAQDIIKDPASLHSCHRDTMGISSSKSIRLHSL